MNPRAGFPTYALSRGASSPLEYFSTAAAFCSFGLLFQNGGEGGIRTHGTLLFNGFQDRLLKPLGHLSPNPFQNVHLILSPVAPTVKTHGENLMENILNRGRRAARTPGAPRPRRARPHKLRRSGNTARFHAATPRARTAEKPASGASARRSTPAYKRRGKSAPPARIS